MTTTESVQERAARLGMDIWLSLLPHAERPHPDRYRSHDIAPAAAYRLTEVNDASDLNPGDVILALSNTDMKLENNRLFAFHSVREAVRQRESVVRLVDSVSAKAVTVYEHLNIPPGRLGIVRPGAVRPAPGLRSRDRSVHRPRARGGS
jgi:hypothetical protein